MSEWIPLLSWLLFTTILARRGWFDREKPKHLRRQKARALKRCEVTLRELFEGEER